MAIRHVQLVSVPVSDQDRAKEFYVDVLGFALLTDQQLTPDMRWVMVAPPGAQTALTLVTWFPSMLPGSLQGMVLETDDLERDIEVLSDRGVTVSELQEAPWGRFVTLADPDGNGIVLQASAANAPDTDGAAWQGHA
jgi:catechol 2,3-dioxygenase-like lactoylglutathione lyase family enzyme